MNSIVINYFKNLYKDNWGKININFNGHLNYGLELDRAIKSIATNKASGIDNIPREFYKNKEMRDGIKLRIQQHFKDYQFKRKVPNYFMNAKLILINKDGTDHPSIDKTRPISILLSITKMLEISILHNLENLTKSKNFNKNQRGFIKSTHHNINDVFTTARWLQLGRTIDHKTILQ